PRPLSIAVAENPRRGVARQLRHAGEELLHVLADELAAQVLAQELVEMGGDAFAEQAAALQRRHHKARNWTEAPTLGIGVLRQLLALAPDAGEQLVGVDPDLLPDAHRSGEQRLLVAAIDQRARRIEGEILELGALGIAEAGNAALDVLHA